MREIKFRAWCIESKRFMTLDGQNTFEIFEDEDFILMQYTGLHDKNGKEIYEGDIVQRYDGKSMSTGEYSSWGCKEPVIVSWDDKRIGWNDFLNFDYGMTGRGQYYLEIIGNIYENPELLKRHC